MSQRTEPVTIAQREPSPRTADVIRPWAHPLDEFYCESGMILPAIESVPGDKLPEPQRTLLVHTRDMTPTLEEYHGGELHLDVLRSYIRGNHYFREVVLRLEDDRPVEFGASKINLDQFSCTARRLILEEHMPLGRILRDFAIPHVNHPKAFLRVEADALMCRALSLAKSNTLFGRRNTMRGPTGATLSEVVEILPPAESHPSQS